MFFIHLLRVKCEGIPQGDFLRSASDPVSIISRAIHAKPTAQVGRGSEWHIGNVEQIKPRGIAFAMGRTQAVKTPQFDIETHNFVEEEAMRAPFTIGVFDPETQTCGVMRKPGVSQSTSEIAGKLEKLLNAPSFARDANSVIVVETIPDPVGFLQSIRESQAVLRFSFTVSRPNPHDVDRLIQGPAKAFTEAAHADSARVEIEGESLDKDIIEDVTKAVAADGQVATARVKPADGGPPKHLNLHGNPVTEKVDAEANTSTVNAIFASMQRAYQRVRGIGR